MADLLAGHALADGLPLGDVLRRAGARRLPDAAAEVDAGHLEAGLRSAGFAPDLATLAAAWPAALREAHQRLAGIPTRGRLLLELGQVLGYFLAVAGLQIVALSTLVTKGVPMLYAASAEIGGASMTEFLPLAEYAPRVLAVGVTVAVLAVAGLPWLPAAVPGVARHRLRARQAALAAALVASGAPDDVRRTVHGTLTLVGAPGGAAAEWEVVRDRAIGRALIAQARLVAVVRGVLLTFLAFVAVLATAGVFTTLSRMPTAVG